MSDTLGNSIAQEGCDRCVCGTKYWENDRCVDCKRHVNTARFERQRTLDLITGAYQGETGEWRWDSNGQCVPDDIMLIWLGDNLITGDDFTVTSFARRAEQEEALESYRASQVTISDEARAEMRAAFGPGATVVNAITGRRYTV